MRVMCITDKWYHLDEPTVGPAYGEICIVEDSGVLADRYYILAEYEGMYVQKGFIPLSGEKEPVLEEKLELVT